jgi:hypothetical protein
MHAKQAILPDQIKWVTRSEYLRVARNVCAGLSVVSLLMVVKLGMNTLGNPETWSVAWSAFAAQGLLWGSAGLGLACAGLFCVAAIILHGLCMWVARHHTR